MPSSQRGPKRRLADEYDAAQAAGHVASDGRPKTVPSENGFKPATSANVGLTRKEVHDARQFRDAEVRAGRVVR